MTGSDYLFSLTDMKAPTSATERSIGRPPNREGQGKGNKPHKYNKVKAFCLCAFSITGKMQWAIASISCCGMVVLLVVFSLRFKYSLRSVCQLYIANGAAVNPSEALRLPPYSFKSRYKLPHPLPFRSRWTKWGKHRECDHTPAKSPFPANYRSGDFILLEASKTLPCLLR